MIITRLQYFAFIAFLIILSTSCVKDDQNDSRALEVSGSGLPVVTTKAVTGVTQVSALCGGRISTDGGSQVTSFGICWSTYENPTIKDFKTDDGSGLCNYSSNMNNLMIGTKYFVRAYAKNSRGVAYGAQQTFTTSLSLELGLNYEGGIIFYLDSSGRHGLVCSETDQCSSSSWGCPNTLINGADAVALGTGKQNTDDIVNDCRTLDIAADYCEKLSLNGYNDWFLPSKDELKLMYKNLRLSNIGNFSNTAYWSSSEMTNVFAWQVVFNNGIIQGGNKGILCSVRAVRAF